MTKPPALSPLMSTKEVSDYIGVPTSTLAVWRCTGRVQLRFSKAGRAVRYRREDVEAFLASGGSPPAEEVRQVRRPKVLSAAARRLGEFRANHGALHCERCDEDVGESEARIASHLELPGIDGPRDPHDWHCFCPTCHEELKQPQGPSPSAETPVLFAVSAPVRH